MKRSFRSLSVQSSPYSIMSSRLALARFVSTLVRAYWRNLDCFSPSLRAW